MKRRWLAPEVVQTSHMDCGPAALKCLFEGHGITTSYERLREVCQTDVDGTSIDTLEEVAVSLGLDAEQVLVPMDHLFLDESESLPALVVVSLPDSLPHFVVAWRTFGNRVQVMDPAVGRRWPLIQSFRDELYPMTMEMDAAVWREWAGGDDFLNPLRRRMRDLGMGSGAVEEMLSRVLSDSGWGSLGTLDAAVRMTTALIQADGLRRGITAAKLLQGLLKRLENEAPFAVIPAPFWTVAVATEKTLMVTGAVLIKVNGALDASQQSDDLSPQLAAAINARDEPSTHGLFRFLGRDGLLAPLFLTTACMLAAGGVLVEALLFRALLDVGLDLGTGARRYGAAVAFLLFVAVMLVLQYPIHALMYRLGRHLEGRMRLAFLQKIPKIGDRFFTSRTRSDMGERGHGLYFMRDLPALGGRMIMTLFSLLATGGGILWLYPASWPAVLIAILVSALLPLLTHPLMAERDLKVRVHTGALSRFYLDALLGLTPVRTHGAEEPLRRRHEELVVTWARAEQSLLTFSAGITAVQAVSTICCTVYIVVGSLAEGGSGATLLVVYWALNMPILGDQLARLIASYPIFRNITLRLLEPLAATEEQIGEVDEATKPVTSPQAAHIQFNAVSVQVAGHPILTDVSLELKPGEHLAVVGASGAGKSSLVGLLLGWYRPESGQVLVDGSNLEGERLVQLRLETAWVDPTVHLWNKEFLENLSYGNGDNTPVNLLLKQADLLALLERLPEGLQTRLGEGGSLVSGGEGQRVRLGRAMCRTNARLVILDEPFRGLDREKRRLLLLRARELWQDATLICISHDLQETLGFERVVVLDGGRVLEDGPSRALADRDSRYARMLSVETQLQQQIWTNPAWRRVVMEDGRLCHAPEVDIG